MSGDIIQDSFTNRKYPRLKEYDYASSGAYFVTICTLNKQCLFGRIENGVMYRNHYGEIIQQRWNDIPMHYPYVNNEVFVVMPNHVHGIIYIHDNTGLSYISIAIESISLNTQGLKPDTTKRPTLPEIIRTFKTFSAKEINEVRNARGTPLWQRSFYEHVIRTETEYRHIGEYILNNAQKWNTDPEYLNLRS